MFLISNIKGADMEIEVIETIESKDIISRNQWQSIALEMSIKIDELQSLELVER